MPVSRRLRFEVLRRDGYTCRYCGGKAPDVTLTVDHVVPVTLGGDDDPRNLVTACADCNAGKSSIAPDSPIVEDVDATALLFSKAMEEVGRRRMAEFATVNAVLDAVDVAWRTWHDATGAGVPRPPDWRTSVEHMYEAGLDTEFMVWAVGDTMRATGVRDEFKFFAGKCWREISTRQEMARRLLEDGEV